MQVIATRLTCAIEALFLTLVLQAALTEPHVEQVDTCHALFLLHLAVSLYSLIYHHIPYVVSPQALCLSMLPSYGHSSP
jgi:hypothetical protein